MKISKDSSLFHNLAAITCDRNEYSDIRSSILLQHFCETVRMCHWLGIEVEEAILIKESLITVHPYFYYHLTPFEDFLEDMRIIDEIMNEQLNLDPKQDSKTEWTFKLAKSKEFLDYNYPRPPY
jgi:hypothetical protein